MLFDLIFPKPYSIILNEFSNLLISIVCISIILVVVFRHIYSPRLFLFKKFNVLLSWDSPVVIWIKFFILWTSLAWKTGWLVNTTVNSQLNNSFMHIYYNIGWKYNANEVSELCRIWLSLENFKFVTLLIPHIKYVFV